MSYAVKFTPVDRPSDGITIDGFDTPRDAWNELLTQLENDQDAVSRKGAKDAYQTAIDVTLERNLNHPGAVEVGELFVYGVIETNS